MRKVMIVLFMTSVVFVSRTAAQSSGGTATGPQKDIVVNFIVRGSLYAHGDSAYQLPISILESLEKQVNLKDLKITGDDGGNEAGAHFEAFFTFSDLRHFRDWYSSQSTQTLLTALKGDHNPSFLKYDLQFSRRAANN